MPSATDFTKACLRLLVLLAAAIALTGCNPTTLTTPTASATPSLTGYWQFQNPQSNPADAIMFQGAILSQGSQIRGIFTSSLGCTPPILDLYGAIDSIGNLNLAGIGAQAQLIVSANPASMTGTASGGGYLCSAIWSGPVTAVKIATAPSAPLTGTFAGTIVPIESADPTVSLSVTLTQATTPDAVGQYPLTGTLTYTTAACSATVPFVGSLAGFQAVLAAAANPPASSLAIVAVPNPAASLLIADDVRFIPSPCSSGSSTSGYSGILSRQ